MVIKRIHQIWVGPNPIPEKSVRFMKQIKSLHPDYEYKLWTDSDLTHENFETLNFINKSTIYAQKADIMRYEIMYRYGGIYLDIDFEVFKCLTPLLTNDLVICSEDENIHRYMSNGFFYSIPGTATFRSCIDNLNTCNLNHPYIQYHTGPWYFKKNLKLNGARIIPTNVMYPVHYLKKETIADAKISSDTYALHHWDKSY